MKRSAILIGSGENTGGNLPGPDVDVRRYEQFLLSPQGGAWRRDEIQILRNPSLNEFRQAMLKTAGADVSVVTFSGHGAFSRATEESVVVLRDGFVVSVSQLRTSAGKQLCIIDACRKAVWLPREARIEVGGIVAGAIPQYVESCRRAYDGAVQAAPSGCLTVLFACGIGQTAGDTHDGGVFSSALLEWSEAWAQAPAGPRRQATTYLGARVACAQIADRIAAQNPPQRPSAGSVPPQADLPFAIR